MGTQVARVFGASGGITLPPAVTATLHQLTGGNPYFLVETIRFLLERGLLVRSEDKAGWKWHDPEGLLAGGIVESGSTRSTAERLVLPASLAAAAGARLDRLSPEVRALVETAAVLGEEFRLRTLAAVEGRDEAAIEPLLAAATREGVISESGLSPGEDARFAHTLLRRACYAAVPARRRRKLHERVAETLQATYRDGLDRVAPAVAAHLAAAGQQGAALRWYLRAGRAASARGQWKEASEALERARAVADEAARAGDEVDAESLPMLRLAEGEAHLAAGRLRESASALGEAARLAGAAGPQAARSKRWHCSAWPAPAPTWASIPTLAPRPSWRTRASRPSAMRTRPPPPWCSSARSTARWANTPARCRTWSRHWRCSTPARPTRGSSRWPRPRSAGRWRSRATATARSPTSSARTRSMLPPATSTRTRTCCAARSGSTSAAGATRSPSVSPKKPAKRSRRWAMHSAKRRPTWRSARRGWRRGCMRRAARHLRRTRDATRTLGDAHCEAEALWLLARAEAESGRHAEGSVLLEHAIEVVRGVGDRDDEFRMLADLAVALSAGGDHAGALRNADEATAIARSLGSAEGDGTAAVARAWALLGLGTGAIEAGKHGVALLEEVRAGERWRAHWALGAALVAGE